MPTTTNPNEDPIVKASLKAPAGTLFNQIAPAGSPAHLTNLTNLADPIDASVLSGGASTFSLPSAPITPNYDIGTLPSIQTLLNPATTPTEQKQTQLESQFEDTTRKLGTKASAQIAQEDVAARKLGATNGLSDFTGQLTDINSQIQTLDKQIAAAPLQTQNEFFGRGATAAGVAPIDSAKNRDLTVKRLGLSAVAQTLQGNIASARDTATRAIDLEFGPVQAEIDYLKEALANNRTNLSREDQKRATQLEVALGERERLLEQQKADKNIIYGWVAEAAKNGATSLLVNQALNATDPAHALQILGTFLSDPVAKKQALAQLEATRANTAATYASIEQTKANTAKTKTETSQTTNSKSQLLNLVGQYREAVKDSSFFSAAFDPEKRTQLQNLKGQITAVYKQQQQLGTLDAGVQKLIDTIFPDPGAFSVTSFSNKAQVAAIDNFVKNQGGTPGAQSYVVNGKTYVKGADGLYYAQ